MKYDEIKSKIESDFESKHIPEIQRFIRQPSVSGENFGITETVDMLVEKLKKLGAKNIEAVKIDDPESKFSHPIVTGEIISNPNKKTVLFYSMYDVQPVFPENWVYNNKKIDPFGGKILDFEWLPGHNGRCILGRGISNQKGPTIAFFNVLDSYMQEYGELPVNIIFALEGEEELGSIHVGPFVDKKKDLLQKADFLFFPAFWEDTFGKISMLLGCRGIISAKVKCKGGDWGGPSINNAHSGYSGVIENPIFKLMEALTSLKNDITNDILVPGIADDTAIVQPNEEDLEILQEYIEKGYLKEDIEEARLYGIKKVREKDGIPLDGINFFIESLYRPGLSINGIEGGYYGDATMTIIPTEAKANIDIRLPPFQKRAYVIEKYSNFMAERFPMIDFQIGKGGYESAKLSFSHPIAQLSYKIYQEFNKEVKVLPLIGGSAPFSIFHEKLQIPFIVGGVGHSGRVHSPLEYAVLKADNPKVGGIIDFELMVSKFLLEINNLKF